MTHEFLRNVYDLTTQGDTDEYYAAWAATYDDELTRNGYRTPTRCADALAQFVPLDDPVLDVGCGTGLSGAAFAAVGFTRLSGQDVNADMLAVAKRSGTYRDVRVNDVGDPYPFTAGTFAALAAVGVIGPGAAPADLLGESMYVLASGGHLVFSLNDVAIESAEYSGAVSRLVESGMADEVFCEHGPHIDALGSGSNVYVLRRR